MHKWDVIVVGGSLWALPCAYAKLGPQSPLRCLGSSGHGPYIPESWNEKNNVGLMNCHLRKISGNRWM